MPNTTDHSSLYRPSGAPQEDHRRLTQRKSDLQRRKSALITGMVRPVDSSPTAS